MKKLTQKEEEIMQVLWELNGGFIKDILEAMPLPKPHYNTLSTMMKILQEKGFVSHKKYGNMLQYQPAVKREDYKTDAVGDLLEKYFDNSYMNMIAHFAKNENMTEEEKNEILKLIKPK